MPRIAKPRKWRGRYVTNAGGTLKVLCLVSEGKKKARDELAKHLAKIKQEKNRPVQEPNPGAATRHTLAEAVADFLKLKRSTKSERTQEYYTGYLKRLADWYGNLEVTQLSLSHGNDYLSRLKDLQIGADKLGPVSVNHHTQTAKALFNYCVECKWIVTNPWRRVPRLPEIGRRRIVTDEEFGKLLTTCEKSRAHGEMSKDEAALLMKDILRVLRFTALRPGELRKLRWDHLLLDENLIVIPASEHKTGTTTSKPRDRLVPFLDDVKAIFEARRQKYGHLSRVFPNVNGDEWKDEVFSRRFNRLLKRAGLDAPDSQFGERLCLYSLRHSRLTEMAVQEGWDLYSLAAFAGHSPEMTQRYVHVNKHTLTQALIAGHRKRKEAEERSD